MTPSHGCALCPRERRVQMYTCLRTLFSVVCSVCSPHPRQLSHPPPHCILNVAHMPVACDTGDCTKKGKCVHWRVQLDAYRSKPGRRTNDVYIVVLPFRSRHRPRKGTRTGTTTHAPREAQALNQR